jgi:hypothetical protein
MRQLDVRLIVLLSLMQATSSPALAADAEPAYRHSISVLGGGYSLSSNGRSSSSLGSLNFGYGYAFSQDWKGVVSYNSILSTAGGVSSFVNGFDVGAQYCLFSCGAVRRQVGDVVEIVEHSRIGLALGAGLAQRAFQLTTSTLSFSGPFFKLETNYFWSDRFRLLGAAQVTTLSNSANSLSFHTLSIGLGLDW